jgi:hypothetical protein
VACGGDGALGRARDRRHRWALDRAIEDTVVGQ